MTTPTKAFAKGLREIKVKDNNAVRAELKEALGVKTRQSLAAYAAGLRTRDRTTAALIEGICKKYGITNWWGNCYPKRTKLCLTHNTHSQPTRCSRPPKLASPSVIVIVTD